MFTIEVFELLFFTGAHSLVTARLDEATWTVQCRHEGTGMEGELFFVVIFVLHVRAVE